MPLIPGTNFYSSYFEQYDILIDNDDNVTVALGVDDDAIRASRAVYRGGHEHTIAYADAVIIDAAGYGDFIELKV